MLKKTAARFILCFLVGCGCGLLIMGHVGIGLALVIIGALAEYTARIAL